MIISRTSSERLLRVFSQRVSKAAITHQSNYLDVVVGTSETKAAVADQATRKRDGSVSLDRHDQQNMVGPLAANVSPGVPKTQLR